MYAQIIKNLFNSRVHIYIYIYVYKLLYTFIIIINNKVCNRT